MEFKFLSELPNSDLDDRTYKELVEECMLRIPRYCPEWSNFNPSDPGITLIELFAWLTDQMLLRFNQVPRRNYVAFLELLGIRLQAPTPAHTEITFYLSRPQNRHEPIPPILSGTEVATERTETEEAVIFSTDRPLNIGVPWIRYCLTAEQTEESPSAVRDRFAGGLWTQDDAGYWSGPEQSVFQDYPQLGNCFYLVFEDAEPLDGNVVMLNIEGEPAGSTGINPNRPPRFWEAWDGRAWQPVLQAEADDSSRGFSFSLNDTTQPSSLGIKKANVRLHLPLQWPGQCFGNYCGRWLRCVYRQDETESGQNGYSRSPKLTGIWAYAIGGTTEASQCTRIKEELLGESNGKPGQKMSLLSGAILPRKPDEDEYVVVSPLGEIPQTWAEVENFADSGPEDLHYMLDSLTGEIQFGPSIREPTHLTQEVAIRREMQQGQSEPRAADSSSGDLASIERLERQHGAVPPRGATVQMKAYRTGGGRLGNVQRETVRILKSALPYVAQVVNLTPALNGADAESLDEAVIRVPSFLRTRDRAVTPEDFETLSLQASHAIARAHCPKQQSSGRVRVLLVPRAVMPLAEGGVATGIPPEQFQLTPELRKTVTAFLDERRVLGIEVLLEEPTYVGVSVQTKVGIAPEHRSPQAQAKILSTLRSRLYKFLNPLTGGADGKGWKFGTPVYKSDVVSLLRNVPGVAYLGPVELFSLRQEAGEWVRSLATEGTIHPGPLGLICAWADPSGRTGHSIHLNS